LEADVEAGEPAANFYVLGQSGGAFIPLSDLKVSRNSRLTSVTSMVAFPNPASGHFNIGYSLQTGAPVRAEVRDLNGRVVKVIEAGNQTPGEYTIRIGTQEMPMGVYTYTLKVGNEQVSGKIIVANN
jgi:hypothetical protein